MEVQEQARSPSQTLDPGVTQTYASHVEVRTQGMSSSMLVVYEITWHIVQNCLFFQNKYLNIYFY